MGSTLAVRRSAFFNGANVSSSFNRKFQQPERFVERRRQPRADKPGKIIFDDLGNAQYQWREELVLGDSGDTGRMRALSVDALGLMDDEPPPDLKTVQVNRKGLRVGYNPYESGSLEKKERRKTRDLRALSQWIQLKKNLPKED